MGDRGSAEARVAWLKGIKFWVSLLLAALAAAWLLEVFGRGA